MTTIEERVSRIEGEMGHVATKADVAELRGEVNALKLTLTFALGIAALGLAVLQVVLKYIG